MNRIIFLISFTFILALHYLAFSFSYKKDLPNIAKPKYSKVSVKLSTYKVSKPLKKVTKKVEKEAIVKKKKFIKPIKKNAKREFVKKVSKKKTKKTKISKVVKAKKEKVLKKEELKKPNKIVNKKTVKKVSSVSKKMSTKSLEKNKIFKNNYMTELRASIDRNKKYPIRSQRLEEEGEVIVKFRILSSGVFKNIELLTSSGNKRLDKAAIKALRLTKSFKPFSAEIKKDFMDVIVPIKFQLNK